MRFPGPLVATVLWAAAPAFAGNTEFLTEQMWQQDCANPSCTANRFEAITVVSVTALDPVDIGRAELRCRAAIWRYLDVTCSGGHTTVVSSPENRVTITSQPQKCIAASAFTVRCTSEPSYRGYSLGALKEIYPPFDIRFQSTVGSCLCPICGGE